MGILNDFNIVDTVRSSNFVLVVIESGLFGNVIYADTEALLLPIIRGACEF